jgi:hypothetical protein
LGRQQARECVHGLALEDPTRRSYNEDMFGYFLALERRRFARTRRPFLLLLVELRKRAGVESRFESRDATRVFDALWDAVRETDFVGWYRDGFVVGAVLTQSLDASFGDTVEGIRDRVLDALCERATANIAGRLQLHVHQLPGGVKEKLQLWP